MILNLDEQQTSDEFSNRLASYNTTLLNHYNHDVYDKKTSCIDLMCELDFDGKEQFKKIINSTIKVNNKQAQSTPQNLSDQNVRSMSNSSKQQTYTNSAYLTTTPKISTSSSSSSFKTFTSTNNHNLNKNHSTKKSLILDSNKNYFNKNKNNTNKPINDNLKKISFKSNQVETLLVDSFNSSFLSPTANTRYKMLKTGAGSIETTSNRTSQLNSDLTEMKNIPLNFNYTNESKFNTEFNKSSSIWSSSFCSEKCRSSPSMNKAALESNHLGSYNNNITNYNSFIKSPNILSSSSITNNILLGNSSVERPKKFQLEAVSLNKTNTSTDLHHHHHHSYQQQLNDKNLFQTSMQNKDKHLLEKKFTSNQTAAYNCDCFQQRLNNNTNININSSDNINNSNKKKSYDDLPHNSSLLKPYQPAQIMSNSFFIKSFEKTNSLQPPPVQYAPQTFMPFKKRSFDQLSSSTQDISRLSPNCNDLNKKILCQSNGSLNRQPSKSTAINSYELGNIINHKKYSSQFNTGLTLPITIINAKPSERQTTISSSANNFGYARKEWSSTVVVPFKKRNFSSFLEGSECSTSSLSSTSTHFSYEQTSSIPTTSSIQPKIIDKSTVPKKSKEHLLDPNRQKKIKRCPHVWQFCGDLLDDPTYNPSIIKWLNKERGIFKIVKPDQVAELWGAQKNRRSDKKMNYEKMARGMRYSRREGFFKKLDKEKNKPNEYGKQLVFQFSEKVVKNIDWKWSFSKN